jgi:hypothetical protein
MTAQPIDSALVECPKCFGSGNFQRFRHIVGGTCFLCGGAKKVSKKTVARWLASQVSRGPFASEESEPEDSDVVARKTVEIQNLGRCRFARYSDGQIRVDLDTFGYRNEYGERETGGLWIVIEIVAGRVVIAKSEDGERLVCNGIDGGTGELTRHVLSSLQSAMKR